MKIVSKVKSSGDVKKDVSKAITLAGGFNIKKGDVVLLKPNYVDDVPFPATTSPDMLKAVIELLFSSGASKVIVGESSYHDTRKVMTNQGALKVCSETNAEFYVFDEHPYVKKEVKYNNKMKEVHVPSVFSHVDKVVFLCCLKTHTDARFTASLKHSIGCIKLIERDPHSDMENIVPLIASLFNPFCIIDARKVFVTEGPTCGEIKEPGFILASSDRVALDVEGLKILRSYKAKNLLEFEPWDYITIRRAIEMGLGVASGKEYEVKNG